MPASYCEPGFSLASGMLRAGLRSDYARLREQHSDAGPRIRFHSLIRLIRLAKYVGMKVE